MADQKRPQSVLEWVESHDGGQYSDLSTAAFNVDNALKVAERLSHEIQRTCTAADIIALAALLRAEQRPIDDYWMKYRAKKKADELAADRKAERKAK